MPVIHVSGLRGQGTGTGDQGPEFWADRRMGCALLSYVPSYLAG